MFGRKKIAALVAEFLGTYLLVSVVFAMSVRTQFPFFAAAVAGLALGLVSLTFGRVSGSHINPVVTLSLWTLRKVQATQAVVYIAAQMLGGFVAYRVCQVLLGSTLAKTASTTIDWKVITAEAIGTMIFTTGVAAAVYRAYDGAKLAATLGVSLMMGIIVASVGSNATLNPAVALGINSFSWSYVAGPLLGGVIGMNLYALCFAPFDVVKSSKSTTTIANLSATTIKTVPAKPEAKKPAKKQTAKSSVPKKTGRNK